MKYLCGPHVGRRVREWSSVVDEATQGIAVLIVIAVLSAIIWHAASRRYLFASVGAALSSAIAFQIVVTIQLGYLDPFFLIALVISACIAGIISLAVGAAFRLRRKSREPKSMNSDDRPINPSA
jgi:hypothetical protein